MDSSTLVRSQLGFLDPVRAQALIADCNAAMLMGGINTVNRAAMFLAQIGHESGSLRYTEEIAPAKNAPYIPYIGRTFIQITWDKNYIAFGKWCVTQGLLSDPLFFHKNPTSLALDRWAWYGAVWYWSTYSLNAYADRGDIYGATRVINGGYNGFNDRNARWRACLSLGSAILPEEVMTPNEAETMIANFGRAVLLGVNATPWLHGSHPLIIPTQANGGLYSRIAKLEAQIAALEAKK